MRNHMEHHGRLFDKYKTKHSVVIHKLSSLAATISQATEEGCHAQSPGTELEIATPRRFWGPSLDCAPLFSKSAENHKGAFKLVIPSAAIDYLPSGDGGRS